MERDGSGRKGLMYVLCFNSVFFALFSFFEPIALFVASGASGLSSNFASSNLRFTPRPLLFFPLLAVFTVEHSAPPIGAFCAASDRVWERVRRLLGGAFDVSFALL